MSTRIYDNNPGVVAPTGQAKADGAIPFGKLLTKGTAAGDVKVAGATDPIYGFSKPDEVKQSRNSGDTYVDGDAVSYTARTPGKRLFLFVDDAGGVTEGEYVQPAAAGDIAGFAAGEKIGIALAAASDDEWVEVLII